MKGGFFFRKYDLFLTSPKKCAKSIPLTFLVYIEHKAVSRFYGQGTDLAVFLEMSKIYRTFWKKATLEDAYFCRKKA